MINLEDVGTTNDNFLSKLNVIKCLPFIFILNCYPMYIKSFPYQLILLILLLLMGFTSKPTIIDRKAYIELNSSADSLQLNYKLNKTKNLKIKFKQSIELIKLLYEKILDLDHHFSSMDISQTVTKLSNPHAYPEFQELLKAIKEKQRQRQQVDMPSVLESNLYVSATVTLVKVLFSNRHKGLDKKEIEKIACILDFTVRMDKELNTIYYETEYLKNLNLKLKKECELVFKECMKVIGYRYSLPYCRDSDDWEKVFELLEKYIEDIEENIANNKITVKLSKDEIDLRFSIDRVIAFIQSYNDFIAKGDNYYKKFDIIVANYRNKEFCINSIPQEFYSLKSDIKITIEKFHNSYNLPELRGSKLKELMYGVRN